MDSPIRQDAKSDVAMSSLGPELTQNSTLFCPGKKIGIPSASIMLPDITAQLDCAHEVQRPEWTLQAAADKKFPCL